MGDASTWDPEDRAAFRKLRQQRGWDKFAKQRPQGVVTPVTPAIPVPRASPLPIAPAPRPENLQGGAKSWEQATPGTNRPAPRLQFEESLRRVVEEAVEKALKP